MNKREKMLAVLVLGSLMGCNSVWAETSNTINVTKNDIPIMVDCDYTNVDIQNIVGESIGKKKSPTTGNYDRSGTVTTDGKSINIKFNTLNFDITEPTDRNSYPTHVIRADQKGNNITLDGKKLIIKATGLNYNGSWTSTTKQATAAVHAKSATVELNVDKTTVVVDTDEKTLLDGAGIIADEGGKIVVNGAIDITVDSGKIGVGMLTNRTGNITVAGDSNITIISDNKNASRANVIGISVYSDNKYSDMGPAVILKGKNTTVHAEIIEGGDWNYATGIMANRDILIDNHENVAITAKIDSSSQNGTRAEGINASANGNVKINSDETIITSIATGNAKAYGVRMTPLKTYNDYTPSGNIYLNNGLSTGVTQILSKAEGANSYGIQSTSDGEVRVGGNKLVVTSITNAITKNAYAVCNDMTQRECFDGGSIYLNAKENIVKAESNKLGSAYALSAIDNTKGGYISVTGKSYIEAKASSESKAYAAYIKNSGLIEINKDNVAEQNVVIGRISANGTGKIIMNLNGDDSSYTGYTDFANTADLDIGLQDGAIWNVKKKSSLDTLTLKDGTIDMTAENKAFSSLHTNEFIGNGGSVHMDIDASTNVDNSDRIYVDGIHSGDHYITLNNVGANTDGAEGTVLVSVKDEQGSFKANDSEGTLYWNKYTLDSKVSETENYDKDWYLDKVEIIEPEEKPTTSVDTVMSVNSLNYHTWRTENDKLLQRMGELRHNGEEEKGAWFRVKGSKIGYDGEFENKYTTYELGYDEVAKRTEDVVRYQGAALSYVDGDSSYNNGSGDNHGKSIGFYSTDQYSKGHYLDLVLKISNMDNDFKVFDTNGNKITGEYDNTGVSISAEYGRKNDLDHGWYIEPQAQLTLGYMGGASYETSNGISVDQSGIKSALGRIGFNIGKKIGEKGIVYAKANLLHEFGGGYDVEMRAADGSLTMSNTYNDTWFEYGVGVAMATSDNSHIYFDVERSTGSDFYKDWQWNAGMRWNF